MAMAKELVVVEPGTKPGVSGPKQRSYQILHCVSVIPIQLL